MHAVDRVCVPVMGVVQEAEQSASSTRSHQPTIPEKPMTPDTPAKHTGSRNQQATDHAQIGPVRGISDAQEVTQLLMMMHIDRVISSKEEFMLAVDALANHARKLVLVNGNQKIQIDTLANRLEQLDKVNAKM
jgi:hypothetical protein